MTQIAGLIKQTPHREPFKKHSYVNSDGGTVYGTGHKSPSPFSDTKLRVRAERVNTGKAPLLSTVDGKVVFEC